MKNQIEALYLQIQSIVILLSLPILGNAQITIDCPDFVQICLSDESCTGSFTLLPPNASTNCASGGLNMAYSSDLGSGVIPDEGINFDDLVVGSYTFSLSITDDCGNEENCTITYEIVDCYIPPIICINGLQVALGQDNTGAGETTIYATDFILSVPTDCSGDITYSIHREGEIPDPSQTSLTFDCSDYEEANTAIVHIYSWDNAYNPNAVQPDGTVGGPNYSYCITYLILEDNTETCDPNTINVYGRITNPEGVGLEGVTVELGPETTETDAAGDYVFTLDASAIGNDYTLIPSTDDHPLNGVTALDILLLRQLILEAQEPSSPYKIIAADINNNQVLSTTDIVELSLVLSGMALEFPNNNSWRFVLADYEFPDPDNPWLETYPEIFSINSLSEDIEINFVGVKIGDLNCTANPQLENGIAATVHGQVIFDENDNCVNDAEEEGLSAWIVEASNGSQTYYSTTTEEGAYVLPLPVGNYEISLMPLTPNWTVCANQITVQLDAGDTQNIDFSVQAALPCPNLQVDISTALLQACAAGTYFVNYRNNGFGAATNAYVEVSVDDFITVNGSSIPWTSVDENTYTFPIGDLAFGESGQFRIDFDLSCDAILGQTHCTTAEIFPNEDCLPENPAWDGSSLQVQGTCVGDSVQFRIKNIGDDMQAPVEFIVIEDDLLMFHDNILLGANEEQFIPQEATGATKRLEVMQAEGHPGNSNPSLSIEGCGTYDDGSFSLGYVTQFTEDDADTFRSIDCQESTDANSSFLKRAFPKGVGAQNYIEANTSLEYHIQFQNTNAEVVETVVLVDQLDVALDPNSLQMGASSHPYTWQLTGEGSLIVVLENIGLPSASTDEAGSRGFIKFRIDQKEDNPIGTIIENSADVYIDGGTPLISNYTQHTIGEDFIVDEDAVVELNVLTPFNQAVNEVDVAVNSILTGSTNEEGYLLLDELESNQSYVFDLNKEALYLDGQSTFDLVLLAQHILNIQPFSNPYLLFAADMDHSASITLIDLLLLRNSILGANNPPESGWYFYRANYAFPNPNNPWAELPNLDLSIPNLQFNTTLDVTAIKKGDLNGTASTALHISDTEDRSPDGRITLNLQLERLDDRRYLVSFYQDEEDELLVYDLQLLATNASLTPSFLALSKSTRGGRIRTIGFPWEPTESQAEELLQLEVEAQSEEEVLQKIQLDPSSIAYTPDFKAFQLVLPENQVHREEFQIIPNPSDRGFEIHHYLARISELELKLFDSNGQFIRSLHKVENHPSGNFHFSMGNELMPGVYFIQLQTDKAVETKRFIKVEH